MTDKLFPDTPETNPTYKPCDHPGTHVPYDFLKRWIHTCTIYGGQQVYDLIEEMKSFAKKEVDDGRDS